MASPAASPIRPSAPAPARRLASAAVVVTLAGFGLPPALAQRQLWMRGPGSQVNPNTEVVPTNCVTAPDGTINCDTELRNPGGQTPARPSLELFEN